jgi:hypothetical protein
LYVYLLGFDEARLYYNYVSNYLENENWNFIKFTSEYKHPNGILYQKNDIYCGIYEPTPLTISMCFSRNIVTIQSPAGDSDNRRNEGAFSPEMSRLGAKGGGSPLC